MFCEIFAGNFKVLNRNILTIVRDLSEKCAEKREGNGKRWAWAVGSEIELAKSGVGDTTTDAF